MSRSVLSMLKKGALCGLLYFVCISSTVAQYTKYTFQQPKMGSPFIIMAYAADSIALAKATDKAFRRVDTLNTIFSDYLETSEINNICKNSRAGQWQKVSPDLLYILKVSLNAAKASKGAFDITVGNIVKMWRKVKKEKQLPPPETINEALTKTGFDKIELDTINAQIRFLTEGLRLDFGGIVKGYAAQEAVRILNQEGFPYALVDAGGDLAMSDKPESTQRWEVAVSVPNAHNQFLPLFLYLHNQAVATSGDLYNSVQINGKTYSHIVNPKTGLGLTHQRNVTIIAPDGALADWLATACSVLSIKKALKLVQKYPQTEVLILENQQGNIKKWYSKGFNRYFYLK